MFYHQRRDKPLDGQSATVYIFPGIISHQVVGGRPASIDGAISRVVKLCFCLHHMMCAVAMLRALLARSCLSPHQMMQRARSQCDVILLEVGVGPAWILRKK